MQRSSGLLVLLLAGCAAPMPSRAAVGLPGGADGRGTANAGAIVPDAGAEVQGLGGPTGGDDAGEDVRRGDAGADGGIPVKPASSCLVRSDARPSWSALNGGQPLGARVLAADQVAFSLFAPAASSVSVTGAFNGWSPNANPLRKGGDGVWTATLTIAQPQGQPYRFFVDGRSVADVYSRANDQNGGSSIVVGPEDFAWTDGGFIRKPREALVIYEVHAGDFTRDATSGVAADKRGKFLGFAGKIDHLQRLGVNAVEFMPLTENQPDGYDWGYSASLFFAPESFLASSSKGAQCSEMKSMIDALHGAGIAVIVDVVLNHVWGQTGVNHFWGVDPVYYFDVDGDGDPENDKQAWGYMLATARPAVRRLVYDNLKLLLDEFHVDGVRIDATEHMDIDALLEILRALDDDGYCDRTFIVEEFDGAHNQRFRQFNAERRRTVVSSWGTGYKNRVWDAIRYPDTSETDLTAVTYFSRIDGWRRSDEVVNYFSSHDEGTISAWLHASKDQVKVAATHLLTAPGIPMIWAGDELLRAYLGNHGTDPLKLENNRFDWTLAASNADLVDYYAALVRLRMAHPTLFAPLAEDPGAHFVWQNQDPHRALGYLRRGTPGDHDFIVLANYQGHEQSYPVIFSRRGTWHVMADGRRATATLPGLSTLEVTSDSTSVRVPATTAMVLMSADANP